MNQQQQKLAQIIQKIDIFRGLSSDEVRQILQVCKVKSYAPNQQVYTAAEPSSEMLILLQGQLVITSQSGEPLGSVTPGASIGEMGVFTGQPRSATVLATTQAGGVVIRKMDVDVLMARSPAMYVKVLKNIVTLLCARLSDANNQNAKHMQTIMRLRDQIEKR